VAIKLTLTDGSGERILTAGTLSIGRGERNDWILPDPERHLSKTHCVLSLENGRCVLTDLSTNGVYVNGAGRPTERDSRVVLTHQDEFRIGDFLFRVEEIEALPHNVVASSQSDPLNVDPLEDPLGVPLRSSRDPAFRHPVRHQTPVRRTDDPFDRDDDAKRRRIDPTDDLFRGATPSVQWRGPSQSDHADAVHHAMPSPRVLPPVSGQDVDFDALIGPVVPPGLPPAAASPAKPPIAPPQAAAAAGGHNPFAEWDELLAPVEHGKEPEKALPVQSEVPARRVPAPEAGAVMESAPPAPTSPGPQPGVPLGAEAALQAFLEGAGVSGQFSRPDAEAALRSYGAIFRVMTEGMRELLMSRSAVKGEFRIDQTMIRSNNNNPLKFSVTPEQAVIALLSTDRTGYMTPLVAAREALQDVKMHEIAVIAGVRSALAALLGRFDPAVLEARLSQGGLSNLLPAARKSRLWNEFCVLYGAIAAEAEDDFHSVFGRAFAKAYTEQSKERGGKPIT